MPLSKVVKIPIKLVRPSKYNPRMQFDRKFIDELARSIKIDGQWDPIIVRKTSNRYYEIISGEYRYRAMKKLGRKYIKAYVVNTKNLNEAYLLALKANLLRRDLNPVEEAMSLKMLLNNGWNKKRIAKLLGKSDTWINSRLKIIEKGSKELLNAVLLGKIPLSYAVKICELSKDLHASVLNKIIKEDFTLKDVEALVTLLKKTKGRNEIIRILSLSKSGIRKLMSSHSNDNRRLDNQRRDITVIKCDCGSRYIIDWKGRYVIKEEVQNVS